VAAYDFDGKSETELRYEHFSVVMNPPPAHVFPERVQHRR
jgi:hypothetical protein